MTLVATTNHQLKLPNSVSMCNRPRDVDPKLIGKPNRDLRQLKFAVVAPGCKLRYSFDVSFYI